MKIVFISLLLVAAVCANAQNTIRQNDPGIGPGEQVIRPGDVRIRYDWIKPSHDFYRCVVTDTSGKIQYDFMMENFMRIDSADNRIVFARYRQVPPGSFSTDTSVTDLRVKPQRMHEIHYQREVSLEMSFADTLASVRTVRKGVSSVKTYPMKSGYFEDNMIEYIFPWLDLKKGIVYTLGDFKQDAAAPSDPFTVEYVFDDVWSLGAGYTVSCQVLAFTHGQTAGYIWIDTANHTMLKEAGNFKGGMFVLRKL